MLLKMDCFTWKRGAWFQNKWKCLTHQMQRHKNVYFGKYLLVVNINMEWISLINSSISSSLSIQWIIIYISRVYTIFRQTNNSIHHLNIYNVSTLLNTNTYTQMIKIVGFSKNGFKFQKIYEAFTGNILWISIAFVWNFILYIFMFEWNTWEFL